MIKRFMILGGLAACAAPLGAQGVIPPKAVQSTARPESVLVGQTVPESLAVTTDGGTRRTLLSFKAPLDLLVVGFFSPRCPANAALAGDIQRLKTVYAGWHVAFLAVNVDPSVSLDSFEASLRRQGIDWSAAQDASGQAAKALLIGSTPLFVVIDESGAARYRGPLGRPARSPLQPASGAWAATQTVIGHVDRVKDPEPPAPAGCAVP